MQLQAALYSQKGFSLVELMIALVIAAVVSLAAMNVILYSEQRMAQSRERSELMHVALAASETLRQASWKAGHRASSQEPSNPLHFSGKAPAMRLHIGYFLDDSGIFTARNCAGNSRNRGRRIIQTTDQLYARNSTGPSKQNANNSLSLYCNPSVGAGGEIGERVNGMAFELLLSDTRQVADNSNMFDRAATSRNFFHRRAVVAEMLMAGGDSLNHSGTASSPFDWHGFVPSSKQGNFAWRLTFPIAVDLQ